MEYMEARMQDRYEAHGNATRPVVAEQQGGGDVLMAINVLMHNWRCGRYKSTYVLARLSQMFPSEPSAAARRVK